MTITFTTSTQARYDCYDVIALDLRLTDGTPCDSFEVTLPHTVAIRDAAALCEKVEISRGGTLLFTGLADEVEVVRGQHGSYICVSGRGMAARLMGAECQAAHFDAASLADILKRYVAPHGIKEGERGKTVFNVVRGFEVTSGESAWSVLRDFCAFSAKVSPRFDGSGALVLRHDSESKQFYTINGGSPIVSVNTVLKRQGIKEVSLFERTTGQSRRRTDDLLIGAGFTGIQNIAVPRGALNDYVCRADAALWTAKRERRRLELELALPFAAAPADTLYMRVGAYPEADWLVTEARTALDGKRSSCTLICIPKD